MIYEYCVKLVINIVSVRRNGRVISDAIRKVLNVKHKYFVSD